MLANGGTSFTHLLEYARRSEAMKKLQHSDLSILRLALYLGYSDASAFTRAFKRWTGVTPKKWKLVNTQVNVTNQYRPKGFLGKYSHRL
jgi:AraC-like DNA-binding protein